MYDLMVEPEEEDAEWCWEEVVGALESLGLSAEEGGCLPANAEGTVWVDVGSPNSAGVLLLAVRAKEDGRPETIGRALDIAFSLAERLGGVVVDMQLGGRVLPQHRQVIETEFLR